MLLRLLLAALLSWCPTVRADPALAGSWSGQVEGQPISVTLDGKGGGQTDGRRIRYQVMGQMLLVEDRGEVTPYQFRLQGQQLLIAGGQLPGVLTLSRGAPGAAAAARPPVPAQAEASGVLPELVGRWCKASSFSANAGGGSQSQACFELRQDGSFVYGSERSASAYGGGMWGGTNSSDADSGRWTATASSITAHSRSGRTSTYRLEKRNHPRNRDPMLCLDGDCYVTHWKKNPW